jgi:lipopolysaccharide biosynthesis glycosyltransferase
MFAGNDKVFDGVLTCVLSILKRTVTDEPFSIYLLTMDVSHIKPEYKALSEHQAQVLEDTVKSYNEESRVIRIDVSDLYNECFADCPNETAYCSPYTLLRLLADEIDIIPDKILYLDADIMFNRDITLLYDHDIEGYEYAAARDHYGKYIINHNYINAGVLLLNMKMIRKTGLFSKAREMLKEKKLPFADQSAIYRNTSKKLMLPQRYNDQKFLHDHTVVRHFSKRLFYLPYPHTENLKQWQIDKVHDKFGYNQFDDIYSEYERIKLENEV